MPAIRMNDSSAPAPSSNRAKYMTLLAAFLGWLFDGFEMGLFPLIGQPALKDLLGAAADPSAATKWFGAIIAVFLVGAACGGVVFGWLGDKLGRVRAMSLSIFTYAIFTGLCGFATEAWHIAGLRFIASLGMGGEGDSAYDCGVEITRGWEQHENFELYEDVTATQLPRPWRQATFEALDAERRALVPLDRLGERRAWRDERLVALAAHKRQRVALDREAGEG